MRNRLSNSRIGWILVGMAAGVALTWIWPHETAQAVATDRDAQFAMTTAQVQVLDPMEGIFVLDFLTGSLKGAALNIQTGKFTTFYYRNVAQDFRVDPKVEAHYSIVSGMGAMAGHAGYAPASSVLYVGELRSGRIICYSFPVRNSPIPLPAIPLVPIDVFQFREPESTN